MVWVYVALGVGVLGLIAGLRYWRSFFHDYAYDALLSFADEAFGGVIGIDFGDFIAAILMYRGERNRIGFLPALFVAWEATNFFPISLLPVFGTGLEYVLNVFPAATLLNVLFNKEDKARKARDDVREFKDIREAFTISLDDEAAKQAYDNNNWVKAASEYEDVLRRVKSEVEESVYDRIREVKQESHSLLTSVQGKESQRSRRIRRTVPRIDDYVQAARDEVESGEYKDAAVDVLTGERLLQRLRHN